MQTGIKSERAGEGRLRVKKILVYFLGYTILFCAAAAAVFVWFWLRKRRFIWQTDGVNQHYYGLLYFAKWGKEVLRQFRETGVLRLPTYSLRMGYGEDIYTTLAYYVIGDPFSLPAVFVPEKYLMHFHDLMLMARFYLAGISFSAYAFYMGRKSRLAVMAGAFVYIFNGFTMSGMRHHYFLNPFIIFPLLLIGCEQYFRKKKPGLFLVMVFIAAVSNFYFFYMMVIMTVLYAVWRSVRRNGLRQFGRVLLDGAAFLWYGLIGTLMASIVFLPVVLRFLQDPRTADNKTIPLFWPVNYYRNFLDCFLTNGTSALSESWTYMGFGAAALLCVIFIFVNRKRHFDLKAAFIGLTCLLMTPLAAFVLNGFSYPANRWMWAYALLIAFMTATAVPEMAEAGSRPLIVSAVGLALCVCVCVFWEYTFSRATAQAVVIALFGLAAVLAGRVVLLERAEKIRQSGSASGLVPDQNVLAGKAEKAVAAAGQKKAGVQGPDGKSAKELTETCSEFVGKSMENTTEKAMGRPVEKTTEKAMGRPVEKAMKKTMGRSVEKSMEKTMGRSEEESLETVRERISVRVQAAFLACVLITAASAGYFDYSPTRSAKVFEYLTRAQVETQMAKDAAAAAQLIDGNLLEAEYAAAEKTGLPKPFYRYTTYNPENNTSLLYGVSNTQYYWSLSNQGNARFFSETGQLNRMIHLYDTLDDRTFLNEIAGIRYFLGNDQDGVPFGYVKKEGLSYSNENIWKGVENLDRFSCEVYENQYALPIGFTTDRWFSREDYEAMDIPQRQQALMQGILLEEDPGESFTRLAFDRTAVQDEASAPSSSQGTASGSPASTSPQAGAVGGTADASSQAGAVGGTADASSQGADPAQTTIEFNDVRVPVTITCRDHEIGAGEKLVFDGSAGEEGGTVVTIRFDGLADCETFLYIRGLDYQPPQGKNGSTKFLLPVTGYRGEEAVVSKQIGFTTPMDPWTTGRKDFLINMRYSAEKMDRIELSLPTEGTFTADSIEVVCQPMTAFPAQAKALQAHGLTDLDIHEMGESGATERITGHVELEAPGILCLQIPRAAGWTAYVDGEKARILQADTMFSALLLPSGSHDIELRWQTPGLRLGAVISAAVLILLLLFVLLYTILSAIFHVAERRREKLPVGTFEEIKIPAATREEMKSSAGTFEEEKRPAGPFVELYDEDTVKLDETFRTGTAVSPPALRKPTGKDLGAGNK